MLIPAFQFWEYCRDAMHHSSKDSIGNGVGNMKLQYVSAENAVELIRNTKQCLKKTLMIMDERVELETAYIKSLNDWANKIRSEIKGDEFCHREMREALSGFAKEADDTADIHLNMRDGVKDENGPCSILRKYKRKHYGAKGSLNTQVMNWIHPSCDDTLLYKENYGGLLQAYQSRLHEVHRARKVYVAKHMLHEKYLAERKKDSQRPHTSHHRLHLKPSSNAMFKIDSDTVVAKDVYHSIAKRERKSRDEFLKDVQKYTKNLLQKESNTVNLCVQQFIRFARHLSALDCEREKRTRLRTLEAVVSNLEEIEPQYILQRWLKTHTSVLHFPDITDIDSVTEEDTKAPEVVYGVPVELAELAGSVFVEDMSPRREGLSITRVSPTESDLRINESPTGPPVPKKFLSTPEPPENETKTKKSWTSYSKKDSVQDICINGQVQKNSENNADMQLTDISSSGNASLSNDENTEVVPSDKVEEIPRPNSRKADCAFGVDTIATAGAAEKMFKKTHKRLNAVKKRLQGSTEVETFVTCTPDDDVADMEGVIVEALGDYNSCDGSHLTFSKGQLIKQKKKVNKEGLAWGSTRSNSSVKKKYGFYPAKSVQFFEYID